jgi:GcrA cell cycle regulator
MTIVRGGMMLQGPIGLSRAPRRRPVSPWTKQRTRVLRRRWAQGARVRDIAAELGHGITYNAVIGKIHRLGISELSPYGGAAGRRSAANTLPADRPVDAPRIAWWFRKGPLPAWVVDAKPHVETVDADARIPRRQRRSLFELSDDTCRWPVGDPKSSRFFFCGAHPLRNEPYCTEHCARAYRHLRDVPQRVSATRPRHGARDATGPSCLAAKLPLNADRPEREEERAIKTFRHAGAEIDEKPKRTAGRAPRAADAGALAPRRT